MPKTEPDYTMNLDNPTALQRLVNGPDVEQMIEELENQYELLPEDTEPEEVQRWEIAFSFDVTDIPYILDELKEVRDATQ